MCKNITLKNFYSPKYVVKKTFQLLQVSTKLHSKVFASIIFPCSFLVFGKQLELKTNSNIRRPTPTLIFLFFFYVFFLMSCLLNPPPPLFMFRNIFLNWNKVVYKSILESIVTLSSLYWFSHSLWICSQVS